ncbi:MAG: hypothetical protein ACXWVM_30180, partial [Polyangiales bacterium]
MSEQPEPDTLRSRANPLASIDAIAPIASIAHCALRARSTPLASIGAISSIDAKRIRGKRRSPR